MDQVLVQSVERVLDGFSQKVGVAGSLGNIILSRVIGDMNTFVQGNLYDKYIQDLMLKNQPNDTSSDVLRKHWEACAGASSEGPSSSPDVVETGHVAKYLNERVAHSSDGVAVSKVMDRVVGEAAGVDCSKFLTVAYLLMMAVRKAQTSVFDDDEDDDECADFHSRRVQTKLSLSQSLSPRDDEDEAPGAWKIKSEGIVPRLDLNMQSFVEEEEACGPLGQGVLSMRGADSTKYSDPWNVFDDRVMLSSRSHRQQLECDSVGAGSLPSRSQISLASTYKKLVGPLDGSSILSLTESEKKACIQSFEAKGYSKTGGMPIRDAIEMYHKLDTKHVHFSRVWALVDPHTTCKIDERCFCAFVALTQSIVEQGPDVKLPNKLSEEDISKLSLELCASQTIVTQERIHIDLQKVASRDGYDNVWGPAYDNLETPRSMCIGAEDAESDYESDDGMSVISRVPSIARSFRSISFRGITTAVRSAVRGSGKTKQYEPSAADMIIPKKMPPGKIDTAAWKCEVGSGHQNIVINVLSAALGFRRTFDRPFVELELRDQMGRLLELPIETAPGIQNLANGTLKFPKVSHQISNHLSNIPSGSTLFFILKQWKESKKKMSTIAWSFVDCDMICDFGQLACRVRQGNLALPLFKKPKIETAKHGTSLQRLNRRHPCLYVHVSGKVPEETET